MMSSLPTRTVNGRQQYMGQSSMLRRIGGKLPRLSSSGELNVLRPFSSKAPPPPKAATGEDADTRDSRIVEVELRKEATSSYLSYAMSVIVGRALPDVRDGCKPVHRRILFAMHEINMVPSKPHRKSARIVGEVLGKFHPHGDTSVYDALRGQAGDRESRKRAMTMKHHCFPINRLQPACNATSTNERNGTQTTWR